MRNVWEYRRATQCYSLFCSRRSWIFRSSVRRTYTGAELVFAPFRDGIWWTLLQYAGYNPDLSPCDFPNFGLLKKALKGHQFSRTAKSWTMFVFGPDFSYRTSISKVFTAWWKSGKSACVVFWYYVWSKLCIFHSVDIVSFSLHPPNICKMKFYDVIFRFWRGPHF